jgi:hypothetical protein
MIRVPSRLAEARAAPAVHAAAEHLVASAGRFCGLKIEPVNNQLALVITIGPVGALPHAVAAQSCNKPGDAANWN